MNPRELFDTHLHLDDEQFAVLLESWEGLGLTKESVGSFYVWPLEQSQVPCTRE